MDIDRQVEVMDTQLSNFNTLLEKLQYLTMFFDPDPEFTRQARDMVRAGLARAEQQEKLHAKS